MKSYYLNVRRAHNLTEIAKEHQEEFTKYKRAKCFKLIQKTREPNTKKGTILIYQLLSINMFIMSKLVGLREDRY